MKLKKPITDVFNILLQIFDEGRLTDSKGGRSTAKIPFHHDIELRLRFPAPEDEVQTQAPSDERRVMTMLDPVIKGHFRPEFINRLDDILPFCLLKSIWKRSC